MDWLYREKAFNILTGLGLTSRQTKIYLALLQLNMATAQKLSDISKVRRENIYRIIPELEKMGLVEKTIGKPITYRAIKIEDAVSILLDRKTEHLNILHKEAKTVIKNFKKSKDTGKGIIDKEETHFLVIPRNVVQMKRKRRSIDNSESSIDIITTLNRFCSIISFYFHPFKKALERGVKIRFITEKLALEIASSNNTEFQRIKEFCPLNCRYSKQPIGNIVGVIDKKEVYINIDPSLRVEESPVLWSNHPTLIEIADHYFENLWNNSLEYNPLDF